MFELSEWLLIAVGVFFLLAFAAIFWLIKSSKKRQEEILIQLSQGLELKLKDINESNLKKSSEDLLRLADLKIQESGNKQNHHFQLAQKEIEKMIEPLQSNLKTYRAQVEDINKERNREYGSLDQVLKILLESNRKLRGETEKLSQALRKPGVRGRWGEVQLRRIVELAGMQEYCDFTEQQSSEDKELLKSKVKGRPDLVVHLPNNRQIVVDAKATMEGYLEAEEQSDERLRKLALERHAESVRIRVSDLSRKSYWEQFDKAVDFVVLFIPGEAFFSAALQERPDLVEWAFTQKVVLATPTTLMSLLKAVAYGWRQEQLTENAKKISSQASKIHQNLIVWAKHFEGMGNSLSKATQHYNDAVGSFQRRLTPAIKQMEDMGVEVKEKLSTPDVITQTVRSVQIKDNLK